MEPEMNEHEEIAQEPEVVSELESPEVLSEIPEDQVPEEYRELFGRAMRSVRIEQSLRDKLVMLQESQQVDLTAFNDLQLRLNARAIAIKVIEQSLEEE